MAWEPSTADLKTITAAIKPEEDKYRGSYKEIRDKVFAHSDPTKLAETLFEKIVAEVEDILITLNETMLAIFQLLENGHRYRIGDGTRSYADRVIADTRSALAVISPGQCLSSPPPVHGRDRSRELRPRAPVDHQEQPVDLLHLSARRCP